MLFLTALFTLTLASLALSATIDDYPKEVQAGREEPYQIKYSPADDIDSLFVLRRGDTENLDTVGELGNGRQGTYDWNVDVGLEERDDYALEIRRDGEESNYAGPIKVVGAQA